MYTDETEDRYNLWFSKYKQNIKTTIVLCSLTGKKCGVPNKLLLNYNFTQDKFFFIIIIMTFKVRVER